MTTWKKIRILSIDTCTETGTRLDFSKTSEFVMAFFLAFHTCPEASL